MIAIPRWSCPRVRLRHTYWAVLGDRYTVPYPPGEQAFDHIAAWKPGMTESTGGALTETPKDRGTHHSDGHGITRIHTGTFIRTITLSAAMAGLRAATFSAG